MEKKKHKIMVFHMSRIEGGGGRMRRPHRGGDLRRIRSGGEKVVLFVAMMKPEKKRHKSMDGRQG